MANPVWQNLQKSQDDSETIEQAIARIVASHNDNANSHLAEGQSLQSHRASEVIDHVVKSVVEAILADGAVSSRAITSDQIVGKDIRTDENVGELVDGVKFNSDGIQMYQGGEKKVDIPVEGNPFFAGNLLASGIFYSKAFKQTNFESLDGWAVSPDGYVNNVWGGAYIRTPNTVDGIAFIYYQPVIARPIVYESDSPYFQVSLKLSSTSDNESYFMIGTQLTMSVWGGFGFKVTNGTLYAIILNNSHNENATEIDGVDITKYHMYRAEMTSLKSIKFYVDNVLVCEVPYSYFVFPRGSAYMGFAMGIKTFAAAYKSMYVESLLMCQDL